MVKNRKSFWARVDNAGLNLATEQKSNPATVLVSNIPGLGVTTVRWIIQESGKYTVTVDSKKGGVVSKVK